MTAQKMARDILANAGHEVIAVSNGAVAAKKLVDKPDMVILDVFMPGYTGIELCEKIRSTPGMEKTPVLLTVGKVEPYDPKDGQRVKADGVIIKPFEATDLLAAVQKIAEQLKPPKPPEPAYEKTMIFQAPTVKEFQDQSYQDWKEETATFDHPPEMKAPTKTIDLPKEMGDAPAFGIDEPAEAVPAAPAFDETVNYAAPVIAASGPVSASAATAEFALPNISPVTPVESGQFDNLMSPPPAMMDEPSAPPAMEFAAAAPIPIEPEPAPPVAAEMEIERHQSEDTSSQMTSVDPAFESDRTRMATDFATKFGTPEPVEEAAPIVEGAVEADPEIETFSAPEPTPAPAAEAAATPTADDDFDARVAAAMAKYGDVPSSSEEVAGTEASVEITPTVSPRVTDPSLAITVPAPVAQSAPEIEHEIERPGVEETQKIQVPVEAEEAHHDDARSQEFVPVPEPAGAAQAPPSGMQDAALVEQMQAAFKDLPVDTAPHEEHAPVVEATAATGVMAAAASAGASVTSPSPTTEPAGDMELARSLAAAVGGSVPSASTEPAPGAPDGSHIDAHVTTTAVHTVLKRMLPTIMMEVVKEMDAAKKKTNF